MTPRVASRVRHILTVVLDRTISALALKHEDWTSRDWMQVVLGISLFLSSAVALGYSKGHGAVVGVFGDAFAKGSQAPGGGFGSYVVLTFAKNCVKNP